MRSQGVMDAEADAETLRRNVFAYARLPHHRAVIDWMDQNLREASNGATVMLHPEDAARAAFRAVPALRCCK